MTANVSAAIHAAATTTRLTVTAVSTAEPGAIALSIAHATTRPSGTRSHQIRALASPHLLRPSLCLQVCLPESR